jgi:hypothetical protein
VDGRAWGGGAVRERPRRRESDRRLEHLNEVRPRTVKTEIALAFRERPGAALDEMHDLTLGVAADGDGGRVRLEGTDPEPEAYAEKLERVIDADLDSRPAARTRSS